jgi:hypothetical protein
MKETWFMNTWFVFTAFYSKMLSPVFSLVAVTGKVWHYCSLLAATVSLGHNENLKVSLKFTFTKFQKFPQRDRNGKSVQEL